MQNIDLKKYARMDQEEIFKELETGEKGLAKSQIRSRIAKFGPNEITTSNERGLILEFLSKLANPLVILLIVIAVISLFFGEKISAIIIILMAILSVILTFIQEHNANKNAKKLQAMVKVKVAVIRDGKLEEVLLNNVVPGDIVELSAGKMIPADMRIIESKDLFINQSALNGESFPVRKGIKVEPNLSGPIYDLNTIAFMGSSVVGGFGRAVVVRTGAQTEFGKLSGEATKIVVETSFDKGIKNFTWLMIRFILILAAFIFAVNAIFKGNLIDALLFSLAIAVGLAPEMLPMLVTVNLSKGALVMAKKKVIIKELDSIQNFGAMDVLCTDKTGTLTINDIVLVKHCGVDGKENNEILRFAYMNSYFQSGMDNLLDKAVLAHKKFPLTHIKKIDEIPFDFTRRIMSVVVRDKSQIEIVSKGAPEDIINVIKYYYDNGKIHSFNKRVAEKISEQYESFSKDGFRVLAIAYKKINKNSNYSKADEKDLIFMGFIAFLDPPKPSTQETIDSLQKIGVKLIILSGDNELVSQRIAEEVKFKIEGIITGSEIDKLSDEKFARIVEKVNIFSRVNPMQKERVIEALQKNKHIVGFLGDGINDAPALKASDVGISVNNAVDIAKETAEIILLEKDLTILKDCVLEGRRVFANIIKYIKMGASSNFGNMLSMTGASIFLPFLPMLPTQILLNNFLYDLSQLSIPTDNVDKDYLIRPKPWNMDFIKKFVIYIGPISSIFDFVTFGVMWFVFHASPELFRTGWFIESLFTQVLVVHIIRTNKIPFIESKPSKALLITTVGIIIFSWIIPYSFLGKPFDFAPLPILFFAILIVMAMAYLILVQVVKKWFIRKFGFE